MPDKYHIKTQPVPPRRPRIGKHGVVDWREDCARCHNCVKKACVYDRYRQEAEYIHNLTEVEALFFDCMGCFSCVQDCTKGILCMSINPEYEKLGNRYWKPDIIKTTWLQAETAKIPVSGAGYRGPFSGLGFDAMWTDMSEIVRPTRDGIHGREYISTSVDIGRKPSYLSLNGSKSIAGLPPLVSIPMPLIIDLSSPAHTLPKLDAVIEQTAAGTGLIAIMDSSYRPADEAHLENIAFYLGPDSAPVPDAIAALAQLHAKLSALLINDSQNIFLASIKEEMTNGRISWPGLPFIAPFVQTLHEPAGDFLFGGLFPNTPGSEALPPELFRQLDAPNLVYYHWEITAGRLKELQQLTRLVLPMIQHKQFDANSAAGQWLNHVGPTPGSSITEVIQTAPDELTFTRKAPGGLTAIELVALANWLEMTNFPVCGFHLPPRVGN